MKSTFCSGTDRRMENHQTLFMLHRNHNIKQDGFHIAMFIQSVCLWIVNLVFCKLINFLHSCQILFVCVFVNMYKNC